MKLRYPILCLLAILLRGGVVQADDPQADDLVDERPDPPATPTSGSSELPQIESFLINCDLPRCEREAELARLHSLSELAVGKPFSVEAGRAAVYYLEQTHLFEEGSVELSVYETIYGGVDLILDTVGQRYIRNVEIDAGLSLESELEQRVFMRPGQRYTGHSVELRRQEEAILDLFDRDGFYGTEVRIDAIDVAPFLVDLQIIVDKGTRLDVDRVYIRGNHVFSYETLRAVVLDELGFFRTFTNSAFEDGLNQIIERYREAGYIGARVLIGEAAQRENDLVDLFIEIREGTQWDFDVSGNRQFTADELIEHLGFEERGYIDEEEVVASTAELEALYRTAGFFFAEVTVRVEWASSGAAMVTYRVSEGPRAEIREIVFEGNRYLSDEQLTELVSTQEFGLLASGGYLQPDQLDADLRTIEAYYREIGFLRAHIPRWSVVAEEDGEYLYIAAFIDEGPRTMVSDVSFTGNGVLSSSQLSEATQLHAREPFGPAALRSDRSAVQNAYNLRGYSPGDQDISSTCISGEERRSCNDLRFPSTCIQFDVTGCVDQTRQGRRLIECPRLIDGGPCDLRSFDPPPEVSVEHSIIEGELVTIGEVFVIGNYQTLESVIRRELAIHEGDVYNPRRLIEGQGNIRRLGLFNSVSIRTIGRTTGHRMRQRVALVVAVEERTSEVIETGFGLSSQSSVDNQFRMVSSLSAGYVDSNFLGRAEELRLEGTFQFDLIGSSQIADGEFIGTAEVVYFDPRFFWFDLVEQPWESRTSIGYFYDLLSLPLQSVELALDFKAQLEFASVEGLFLDLETRFSRVQTRTIPSEAGFEKEFIIRITPALRLDLRDNQIHPRRGLFAELRVDLADDFIAINAEEYTRVQIRGSHFIPMFRHFVLGTHLRFGFALGGILSGFDTFEDPTLPNDERLILPELDRFRLGGLAGMRGFPDNGLGPLNHLGVPIFGDVVLNGTAEVRFPLIPSMDLYGATFIDAGQLVADFSDLSTDNFRLTTGLGIRWLVFGVVPVILDYGLVLDRHVGEGIGLIHFNVGYTF